MQISFVAVPSTHSHTTVTTKISCEVIVSFLLGSFLLSSVHRRLIRLRSSERTLRFTDSHRRRSDLRERKRVGNLSAGYEATKVRGYEAGWHALISLIYQPVAARVHVHLCMPSASTGRARTSTYVVSKWRTISSRLICVLTFMHAQPARRVTWGAEGPNEKNRRQDKNRTGRRDSIKKSSALKTFDFTRWSAN